MPSSTKLALPSFIAIDLMVVLFEIEIGEVYKAELADGVEPSKVFVFYTTKHAVKM